MILQLNRLEFSHHRRRNHHSHRMSEVKLAHLQSFRSLVSDKLKSALESLNVSELCPLSLTWIGQCFRIVPVINEGFAKLMVEIDYPVSRWEPGSVDEYLDYTIALLEVLNGISSSIAHVNRARVSLAHALSVMESSPALAIERMAEINVNSGTQLKKQSFVKEFKAGGSGEHWNRNEDEWIFHEAMVVLETTIFWLCGAVLSVLRSEIEPDMEIAGNRMSMDSSLMALDCIFKKKLIEQRGVVKEIEGVNECVRLIISSGIGDSDGRMELKRRLKLFGTGLMCLKEEEGGIFRIVMSARNEVLDILRRRNN